MTEENILTLADCYKYYKATIIYEQEKFFGIGDFFRCSNETLNISDCKLILRDISQLTDEEKRHIWEYLSNVKQSDIDWNSVFVIFCYCKTMKDTINLLDYLREKNIMIEKPNWFKIGKAVKDGK